MRADEGVAVGEPMKWSFNVAYAFLPTHYCFNRTYELQVSTSKLPTFYRVSKYLKESEL